MFDHDDIQDLAMQAAPEICSACSWHSFEPDEAEIKNIMRDKGLGDFEETGETYNACPWCGAEIEDAGMSLTREEAICLITSLFTLIHLSEKVIFRAAHYTVGDTSQALWWMVDHPMESEEYDRCERVAGDLHDHLYITANEYDADKAQRWIGELYSIYEVTQR